MNNPIPTGEQLSGRVAVITGAGQGVGWGIAQRYAEAGAALLLAQRNVESGEKAASLLRSEYGSEVEFIQTDVCQKSQVEAMIARALERFGRIDILVNNAGGSFPKRLEQHTDADMALGLDLNFWSAFWAMRAAFPQMKAQRRGRIINLGSLNGVNAHLHTAQYNIGKEALRALSRTSAVEWGQYGITCNVICPNVASPAAEVYLRDNPQMMAAILEQIPTRKMGQASPHVGGLAVFLATDDAAQITGMTIHADGGSHVNGVSWRPDVD